LRVLTHNIALALLRVFYRAGMYRFALHLEVLHAAP